MEDRDGDSSLVACTWEEPSGLGNDCYPLDMAGVETTTLRKVSIYGVIYRFGIISSTSISIETFSWGTHFYCPHFTDGELRYRNGKEPAQGHTA